MDRDEISGEVIATRAGSLLFGADEAVGNFVAENLPDQINWGSYRAIGVLSVDRSQLVAGVVYHNYTGTDVLQSIAATAPTWCRPSVLRGLFFYPYVTLNCRRTTVIVSASNKRSLKLVKGLGYVQEGVLREGGIEPGEDAILLGMMKAECKWLL